MGWPDTSEALKTFYPTNVLVTGHDIIFFWVARMIVMGLEFHKDVPFRHVYIHGLVRDSQGRKMSKSTGNSVDPVEMIEKHGADALRFTFLAHIYSGKDFKFSEQRLEGYRNFMNKVWNATRFALKSLEDFKTPEAGVKAIPSKIHLSIFDQWIITKLKTVEKNVEDAMEQMRFSDAANALYTFVWYEFCDWYIELIKPIMNGTNVEERAATQLVLAQVLNRIMRLLHPFAPFITEELYQKIPIRNQACIVDAYPTVSNDREFLSLASDAAALEIDLTKEVVTAIRNIRGENRISPAQKINVKLDPGDAKTQKILGNNQSAILSLGRIENLEIGEVASLAKCAVAPVVVNESRVNVVIPLEGLVDLEEEVKRLQKQVEKLNRDISGLTGRLNNPNFIANAAEDVVEADKAALEQAKQQVESLRESLIRLQS
jgi:valyl-tRNA synthetase